MLGRVGAFRFYRDAGGIRIQTPGGSVIADPAKLRFGLQTYLANEMEIEGQVEFERGFFVVHEEEDLTLRVGGYRESFPKAEVAACFRQILAALAE